MEEFLRAFNVLDFVFVVNFLEPPLVFFFFCVKELIFTGSGAIS